MDLYEQYMTSLDEPSMRYESTFVFFCTIGIDFYMHMTKAKNDTVKILAGFSPITYKDFSNYQRIKLLLEYGQRRCELLKEFTDLPYAEAAAYIRCMLDECSMLIKLHLSKTVPLEEVVLHIDERDKVHPDAFNKLILPDLLPEDRRDVVTFETKFDERTIMMYTMLLMDCELGL